MLVILKHTVIHILCNDEDLECDKLFKKSVRELTKKYHQLKPYRHSQGRHPELETESEWESMITDFEQFITKYPQLYLEIERIETIRLGRGIDD